MLPLVPSFHLSQFINKAEIEQIIEIVDPDFKRSFVSSQGSDTTTERRCNQEKTVIRKSNAFERKNSQKELSKPGNKPAVAAKKESEEQLSPSKTPKTLKAEMAKRQNTKTEMNATQVINRLQTRKSSLMTLEIKQKPQPPQCKNIEVSLKQENNPANANEKLECKVIEMFDNDSDNSFWETVKFKDFDEMEIQSVYSVADSTVVVSASSATPKIAPGKNDYMQKPVNIHATPKQGFQSIFSNMTTPVKIPRLNLTKKESSN